MRPTTPTSRRSKADEEQVNLTRFDLFFPGEAARSSSRTRRRSSSAIPQQIDLFFSRRIGLSPTACRSTFAAAAG
jgi:hypothetical protein